MDPNDVSAEWGAFFSAVANAGAALVGLVFVGVSIHLGRHPLDRRTWSLATMAVVNLLHPVLASLGMLVPISLRARGAGLLVLALAGLGGTVSVERVRRRLPAGRSRMVATYRSVIPIGAVVVLVAGAIALLLGELAGVYGVALFIGLMVIAGTQNAWDLLLDTQVGVLARGAAVEERLTVRDD